MKILEFVLVSLLVLATFAQDSAKTQPTNLYELLELTPEATSDQIKKAFRKLSVKFHPDRNAGDQTLQKKFLQIKRAYENLIDVSKRNTYDLFGQEGLKQIQQRPKPKGGDFRTDMSIPLSTFYTGGPSVYSFRRGEICKHCKGTGDTTGTLHTCSVCSGSGKMVRKVKTKDGVKDVQMKCKECDGSGHAGKQKCPFCNGQKIVLKPRDLHFEVEKGMRAGDKVLFKGESQQGFEFYPGDVYLTLHQQSHNLFKRQKNDLLVNLDISLKDAILGFERKIKHLDGHEVEIVGDYNVQDGEQIRIDNEGMPVRGEFDTFGDLIAKLNIKFPTKYTSDMLDDLKQIFDAGRKSSSNEQL